MEKFGSESCFESFEEYKNFADVRLMMTFIRFSNFWEIANPESKEELVKVIGSLRRFGIRRYLDEETARQLV